jgi:fructokinase
MFQHTVRSLEHPLLVARSFMALNSAPPIVVGLGEAVWDIFPESRRPGGAPANVAFQADQLGARGVVLSRVGADDLGQEIRSYLESKGLDTSHLQTDVEHGTGRVTVDTSDPGHPRYVIHEGVAWDYIAATDSFLQLADQAAAVCFGTLAQRSPVSRASIQQFIRRTRGLVVFDVNLRQKWYDRESLDLSLQRSSIVKLNIDELAPVSEELGLRHSSELVFANSLRERYPIETVIITRAEHGCFVASGKEVVDVPGVKANVVDAVGAGDAFTAAFILLTLEGRPLELRTRFANRVGGIVVERPGAMPDVKSEYAQLRQEFGL